MGCWIGITNRGKWWSTAELTISGRAHFRLNKYMSSNMFEGILGYLRYRVKKDVGYFDGFLCVRKIEEAWKLNMDEYFNT